MYFSKNTILVILFSLFESKLVDLIYQEHSSSYATSHRPPPLTTHADHREAAVLQHPWEWQTKNNQFTELYILQLSNCVQSVYSTLN